MIAFGWASHTALGSRRFVGVNHHERHQRVGTIGMAATRFLWRSSGRAGDGLAVLDRGSGGKSPRLRLDIDQGHVARLLHRAVGKADREREGEDCDPSRQREGRGDES